MDCQYQIPKELRVSTMTATSKFSCSISLDNIFEVLTPNTNIICIEYGDKIKGVSKKKISNKKKLSKKVFFNQITIIISFKNIDHNIKLFNNGSISMTGVKSKDIGYEVIQYLFNILKSQNNKKIFSEENSSIINYNIVLINSDYNIGYELKREKLHQLLVKNYSIYSSYESCIYPGVNSKYFWNEDYKDKPFKGKCYCTGFCDGKGTGKGESNCKKITISAFQSGSIIITGANSVEQITTTFNFINTIFNTHKDILKKDIPSFIEGSQIQKNKKKNVFYIKKSNIIYTDSSCSSLS